MLYSVKTINLKYLETRLATIRKKCEKCGCPFSYQIVGTETRKVLDDCRQVFYVPCTLVEVTGTAVLNGWTFVGSLESTPIGNIVNNIAGVEIPERFKDCPLECEHCHTRHARRKTFLVQNENGEIRQVGSACLALYTHGISAETATALIDFHDEMNKPFRVTASDSVYVEVKVFLAYVAELISRFGFIPSKGEGIPTFAKAYQFYRFLELGHECEETAREIERTNFSVSSDSQKTATIALDWLETREDSDYFHNVKAACSTGYAPKHMMPLIASLIQSYHRYLAEQEKEAKREEANAASKFVGEIGQRITFDVKSYKVVTSWDTQWGSTSVYEIIDTEGNTYTWKTSNCMGQNACVVTGTIKAHNEFRGCKQTELTRCKIK